MFQCVAYGECLWKRIFKQYEKHICVCIFATISKIVDVSLLQYENLQKLQKFIRHREIT